MKTLFLLVFPNIKMKTIPFFHSIIVIGLFTILSTGCEKGSVVDVEVEPEPKNVYKRDSIYFEVEGKPYSSRYTYSSFVLNGGVDLKYLNAAEPGMKNWVSYSGPGQDGRGYYSPIDSIYYGYGKTFETETGGGYRVAFYKGFHTSNLNYIGAMWYPRDMRKMLEKGRQGFALDAENRNSLDGVSIVLSGFGSTGMYDSPYQESTNNYNQDDSHFEIIKTEQVTEDLYRIEASFEVNVYSDTRKLRVTKGYLVLNVPRERFRGIPYFK